VRADINCSWWLLTGPTLKAVSVEEAKTHLRITDDAGDQSVEQFLATAVEEAEQYMGRGLLTQSWKAAFEGFANELPLPMAAPLQSVTSVKYHDTAGVQQTLATSVYDVDLLARPGCVRLKAGQSWPSLQSDRRGWRVEVIYVVGWTEPSLVPERIKQGIRQFVAYLDLDREGLEPQALAARQAAERLWSDRISWTPPRWDE
jgi:uncharacterized phiE125 gp8 family phage protein